MIATIIPIPSLISPLPAPSFSLPFHSVSTLISFCIEQHFFSPLPMEPVPSLAHQPIYTLNSFLILLTFLYLLHNRERPFLFYSRYTLALLQCK